MKAFFDKIYKGGAAAFFAQVKENLIKGKKMFIVTANPEAFMLGEREKDMAALLCDEDTTVIADGIGIVKGARMVGVDVAERIPGVELAKKLLEFADESSGSVFLLGAKREVLDALCERIAGDYPNITLCGAVDGYTEDKDAVFEKIKQSSPDIVLVALGMPAQEKLIYRHYNNFKKGIFVGVGGSFDVLSGQKSRAPKFFIKYNLEWFYRIMKEPKRIKRFYDNNIKFILKLMKDNRSRQVKK